MLRMHDDDGDDKPSDLKWWLLWSCDDDSDDFGGGHDSNDDYGDGDDGVMTNVKILNDLSQRAHNKYYVGYNWGVVFLKTFFCFTLSFRSLLLSSLSVPAATPPNFLNACFTWEHVINHANPYILSAVWVGFLFVFVFCFLSTSLSPMMRCKILPISCQSNLHRRPA